MRLNPYLFFNGNCEEAFNVYAKLLGGKIEMMMAHKGSPAEAHVAPEWGDKIMHARRRCRSAPSRRPCAGCPSSPAKPALRRGPWLAPSYSPS